MTAVAGGRRPRLAGESAGAGRLAGERAGAVAQTDLAAADLAATGPATTEPAPLVVDLRTATTPVPVLTPAAGRPWSGRYVAAIVLFDALAVLIAGLDALLVRFPGNPMESEGRTGLPYVVLILLAAPAWVLVMAVRRAYEPRYLGVGSEEFRRVANGAVLFTAVFAVVCYALNLEVARRFVAIALPLASFLALTFRYIARKRLHHHRALGVAGHRVVVVGDGSARDALSQRMGASLYAGLTVVGADSPRTGADGEPSLLHVVDAVARLGADTVAVAHSPGVTPDALRKLAWALEGTGIDLLVAPALTDIAGPRINVRPVSGLPLLQVAEPEFGGARRLLKATLDRTGAGALIVALSPVLLAAALAVRVTSPGPIIFRQQRIGQDGVPFTMFKFRSMVADAEARRQELQAGNDHDPDHVLFKMAADPRITRVGSVLRRYSLDEVPQLFNVLRGEMSLVGPRPQLPAEVARYGRDVHRRLLVKPGMTGLWQVSGRADLDWHETVRLDLYYVENWSPALDAEILWKTLFAVLHASGAR